MSVLVKIVTDVLLVVNLGARLEITLVREIVLDLGNGGGTMVLWFRGGGE